MGAGEGKEEGWRRRSGLADGWRPEGNRAEHPQDKKLCPKWRKKGNNDCLLTRVKNLIRFKKESLYE